MSFVLSVIVLLGSAVSSVAESKQIVEAINQNVNPFHEQTANLLDLQAKNPPCDPVRCY
jgi:heme exporter protein D